MHIIHNDHHNTVCSSRDMDMEEDQDDKTPLQHLNAGSDPAAVMALERAHNATNMVYQTRRP